MENLRQTSRAFEERQQRRVAVKFIQEFPSYEDGAEIYFTEGWRNRWIDLTKSFHGITLKRVYTSVSPEIIQDLVAIAVKRNPDYQPPNFLTFFAIDVSSLELAEKLAKTLMGWRDIVEYAYVESLPSLPTTQPQHYVEAPYLPNDIGGINATYAWGVAGGSGSGISFIDIEKGWCLNHPDLLNSNILGPLAGFNWGLKLLPNNTYDYTETQHGTNVLGILAAQASSNHVGWNGIAFGATANVISAWGGSSPVPLCDPMMGSAQPVSPPYQQPGDWSVANAIMTALSNLIVGHLTFGDVLLLEVQVQVQVQNQPPVFHYWPAESEDMIFSNIELATNAGIVVVEAAGNQEAILGADINDTTTTNPINSSPNRTRDSGAIIVGAAKPTSAIGGTPGSRSSSSNFGTRVNCFAWGDTVYSLNIDLATGAPTFGNPPQPRYTPQFTGTSAATAIVAGAAILVQGIAKAHNLGDDPSLTGTYIPSTLRTILSTYGTSSNNPATDCIGMMPDLKKIIDTKMGLAPIA